VGQVELIVGRAILPAAAFQAALFRHFGLFRFGNRRLKAGGSQDWLPHKFRTAGFHRGPRANPDSLKRRSAALLFHAADLFQLLGQGRRRHAGGVLHCHGLLSQFLGLVELTQAGQGEG
jgi:hypothetical protein